MHEREKEKKERLRRPQGGEASQPPSCVICTLMSKPFAFFNKHRLGCKSHKIAFDNESRPFLAKEERFAVLVDIFDVEAIVFVVRGV